MFDIRFDPATRMLHLRLSGFWDRAVALQFVEELASSIQRIKRTGDGFTCLSDARAFPPQSAAVAQEFGAMAATASARKCAIVVGSALAKLQATRTMSSERVKVFLDQVEAEHWLNA